MASCLGSRRSNAGVGRLAELLPRGRFELVERSRTFIPEDNPARLVELVREFLEE
jgi:hypothetical protein